MHTAQTTRTKRRANNWTESEQCAFRALGDIFKEGKIDSIGHSSVVWGQIVESDFLPTPDGHSIIPPRGWPKPRTRKITFLNVGGRTVNILIARGGTSGEVDSQESPPPPVLSGIQSWKVVKTEVD